MTDDLFLETTKNKQALVYLLFCAIVIFILIRAVVYILSDLNKFAGELYRLSVEKQTDQAYNKSEYTVNNKICAICGKKQNVEKSNCENNQSPKPEKHETGERKENKGQEDGKEDRIRLIVEIEKHHRLFTSEKKESADSCLDDAYCNCEHKPVENGIFRKVIDGGIEKCIVDRQRYEYRV